MAEPLDRLTWVTILKFLNGAHRSVTDAIGDGAQPALLELLELLDAIDLAIERTQALRPQPPAPALEP